MHALATNMSFIINVYQPLYTYIEFSYERTAKTTPTHQISDPPTHVCRRYTILKNLTLKSLERYCEHVVIDMNKISL